MKSCDISHKVIESVSGNSSCGIKIYAIEALHYFRVIRNLEIRHDGLAVALYFYVFAVILSYGNGRIYDIGDDHHLFLKIFLNGLFFFGKSGNAVSISCNFGLYSLCLFLLSLCHEHTDLL